MKIKTIKKAGNLRGKRVLVRCDFNVPIKGRKVADDFKIVQSLPTVRYLVAKGARVVLLTHLGRPKGKKDKNYKLKVVSHRLTKLLGGRVKYVEDCVNREAQEAAAKMKSGQVVLLENLRFYKGEEDNNKEFAESLAGLADIYVNDAMAVSHREHASVSAVREFLPSYAGLLLEKEIENLQKVLKPEKPLVAIIGGAKIETKVPVIRNLAKKASKVLIGGMLAYDFLAAKKWSTGKYRVDKANAKLAKKLLSKKVILPVDLVVSNKSGGQGKVNLTPANKLPKNCWQYDIGPETIRLYAQCIKEAKTVIWNGPMGMFEEERFRQGTLAVARLVAEMSSGRAFGVVGGGETVSALKQTKMLEHVDWVSTSGGAMLAYLAGEKLPGLLNIVR